MQFVNFIQLCLIEFSLYLTCSTSGMPMPTPGTNDMNMSQIMNYLEKYQYLGEKSPDQEMRKMSQTNMSMAVQMALTMFQQRYTQYNLSVTGQADAETINLMMTPRCGVADMITMNDMTKRKKRYMISGAKWNTNELTYKITQYPQDGDMTRSEVDHEIVRAFMVWEAVTPLNFVRLEVNDQRGVDIEIKFVQPYSDHGDGYPFDGPGGTLAHAFFPQDGVIGGDSHFDEAETWTLNTPNGVNLFQVAAHEFGHALGLHHSNEPTALMAPFYPGYLPTFTLPEDDRLGIQAIYGTKPEITTARPTTTTVKTAKPPTMGPATDLCKDPRFDAITTMFEQGEKVRYGFRGAQYFKLVNGIIADGFPRSIKDDWSGLPDNIDAALFWDAHYEENWEWNESKREWERVKKQTLPPATFIFKGADFYKVEDMKVLPGYPKSLSLWGIPNDIDASFVWKTNGKTYLFKGRNYYRYTENKGVDPGYPRDISVWGDNLPDKIDTVIPSTTGQTYFFSGKDYYVYGDTERKIVHSGKIEPFWFKCDRFADFTSAGSFIRQNFYVNIILSIAILCLLKIY